MQSFFKFVSKLNFILFASALLYSTSFNSHQFSWLGASYVSVLQRACTWVYKQANFSLKIYYDLGSRFDYSSTSPVFTSPPPAALVPTLPWKSCCSSAVLLFPVLPCISIARCFSRRPHAQSTKVCSGGPTPSQLKFALEDPCPVD